MLIVCIRLYLRLPQGGDLSLKHVAGFMCTVLYVRVLVYVYINDCQHIAQNKFIKFRLHCSKCVGLFSELDKVSLMSLFCSGGNVMISDCSGRYEFVTDLVLVVAL